jgi:hypothetical protein
MNHLTKEKGDLAVVLVIADLTAKGYYCFIPVATEHLPFDLIAYKNGICYRIQSKYSEDGFIKNVSSWSDKKGTHQRKYKSNDFDFYGIYIPKLNIILYPSIKFGGRKIAINIPNSATPFYWWEDFKNFTEDASKKSYKDFNKKLSKTITDKINNSNFLKRKVERPSKDELEKLIWEKPMTKIKDLFGVSDKTIAEWVTHYSINKPPKGYWIKSK